MPQSIVVIFRAIKMTECHSNLTFYHKYNNAFTLQIIFDSIRHTTVMQIVLRVTNMPETYRTYRYLTLQLFVEISGTNEGFQSKIRHTQTWLSHNIRFPRKPHE